jgi:CTP-dependent riboflavin kinase
MEFTGKVYGRTDGSDEVDVPSESKILRLNPGRVERIRTATGWDRVEPGSLNVRVESSVVRALAECRETIHELACEVTYPMGLAHIPRAREAYMYYFASAASTAGGQAVDILVRRAKSPHSMEVLELFSHLSLRKELELSSGSLVHVKLRQT